MEDETNLPMLYTPSLRPIRPDQANRALKHRCSQDVRSRLGLDEVGGEGGCSGEKGRAANQVLEERTSLVNNDPALLRACTLRSVVSRFGELLEPSGTIAVSGGKASTEDTYVHSSMVKRIECFMSHSWRDSATLKWLTLLWFENYYIALLIASLCTVLAAIPTLISPEYGLANPIKAGPWHHLYNGPSSLVFSSVFLLAVFFVHSLRAKSTTLFLDKVCIHQTDPELKSAGIRSLGAFLKHSDRMLVLFSEDYFNRLWCNYEISLYLLLKGPMSVQVVPLELVKLQMACAICNWILSVTCYLMCLSMQTIESVNPENAFQIVSAVWCFQVPAVFILVGCYKSTSILARRNLQTKLKSFEIRKSDCFCCQVNHVLADGTQIPCDRQFVENSINVWYGNGEDNGLDVFDSCVREEVSQQVFEVLGPETISPFAALVLPWIGLFFCMAGNELPFWRFIDAHDKLCLLMSCLEAFCVLPVIAMVDALVGSLIIVWHSRCGPAYIEIVGGVSFFILFTGLLSIIDPITNEWFANCKHTALLYMILLNVICLALGFSARFCAP
eukprot:TRINITY_DN59654_c0_g1_i1.p1 TRINITY_DN59654_c0_g1~~TRINITY_DN59654_c0_g1_i1.p1  ORF type:complete len:558 (+),score=68.58 TRINITY_DN59654_c0_g1_i1:163-1836(+)